MPVELQLHIFTDASQLGFSAAAYLRLVFPDGGVEVAFLMAKTHVAPLKQRTIPQLELKGACEGVDLTTLIATELHLDKTKTTFSTPTHKPCCNGSTRKRASSTSSPAIESAKSIEKPILRSGDALQESTIQQTPAAAASIPPTKTHLSHFTKVQRSCFKTRRHGLRGNRRPKKPYKNRRAVR